MYFTYVTNFIYYILRGTFVLANNLYCIPTYVVWVFILTPIRLISEEIYWKIEGQLFYWLLTMVAFWSYSAGYDIVETGDMIHDIIDQECMVLVNHQSTSDVPLLMAAFSSRNHLLQNLTWIMDGVFKYTNFGVVSVLHGDFFIAAGRDTRDVTLEYLKTYLKEVYITRHRKWIVLFPEGGFLRKRREAGHRYARKMNLPLLNNVTLPRLGAIQAIMDTIGPKSKEIVEPNLLQIITNYKLIPMLKSIVKTKFSFNKIIPTSCSEYASAKLKYVVDMTIAYPRGDPLDLGSIVFGYHDACDVRMHFRVFPIESVPDDSEKLQEWVYDRYIEKEYLLDYYYKTGVWEPKVIELSQRTSGSLADIAQHNDNDNEEMVHIEDGLPAELQTVPYVESVLTLSPGSPLENSSHTLPQENQTEVEESPPFVDHTESNNSTLVGETRSDSHLNGSQRNEGIVSQEIAPNLSIDSLYRAVRKITNSQVSTGRKNHQDVIRIGLIHIVFIFSTAFHIYGGYYIYTFVNSKLVS